MNPSNNHGEENGGHYFNQLIIVNITNEGRNQNRAPEVMHWEHIIYSIPTKNAQQRNKQMYKET